MPRDDLQIQKLDMYDKLGIVPQGRPRVQDYFLKFAGAVLAAQATINGQPTLDCLLEDLTIAAGTTGFIDDIRIANQSVNCSLATLDVAGFTRQSLRRRWLGIQVRSEKQVSIIITPDAGGASFRPTIGIRQIPQAETIDSQINNFYQYYGLGSVSVPAAGVFTMTVQCQRACKLHDLLLQNHTAAVADSDLSITSIRVANVEMLNGLAGDSIPIERFANNVDPTETLDLNQVIKAGQSVTIDFANADAVNAAIIGGHFYTSHVEAC